MILYIYSKCSTCQAALKFLQDKNIKPTIKEIVTEPPTVAELTQMLAFQKGQIKKLLNTSGQLYREMQLTEKVPHMSQKELFDLLSEHGMLIKRPFLLADTFGLTGFKEAEWAAIIPSNDSTNA